MLFTSIVSTLCFKHVWNVDPCLRTRISFQHCVSNTFGLRFRVWVQAFASCFLGQTRLDKGSLSAYANAFRLWMSVCAHASVSSLVQTRLIMVACLFRLEPKWLRLPWIIPCICLVLFVFRPSPDCSFHLNLVIVVDFLLHCQFQLLRELRFRWQLRHQTCVSRNGGCEGL